MEIFYSKQSWLQMVALKHSKDAHQLQDQLNMQSLTDISSGTYTGMNNGTSGVRIGAAGWSPSTLNVNGGMDEIKVYKDRVLTADEISTMYTTENAGTSVL